jgi:hypothetical protein
LSSPKNYLSRLPDLDRREHPRRQTNKVAKVYHLRHGVRGYSSQSCRMDNISESGCHVCRIVTESVPDFVYFVLEGLEAKFPCAVIDRADDGLHLKFMTALPTELVDRIADKRFPAK